MNMKVFASKCKCGCGREIEMKFENRTLQITIESLSTSEQVLLGEEAITELAEFVNDIVSEIKK